MAYSQFDRDTWDDPWFFNLAPKEQNLFIYLFTNKNIKPSGIYEIPERTICYYTKTSAAKLTGLMVKMSPKVIWDRKRSVIWVRNFFRRNCHNDQYAKSAYEHVQRCFPDLLGTWVKQNADVLRYRGVPFDPSLTEYEKGGFEGGSRGVRGGFEDPLDRVEGGLDPPSDGESDQIKTEHKQNNISSSAISAAALLAESVLSINPKNRELAKDREEALARWAKDLDLLHRQDDQSWEDINRILRWLPSHYFWPKNIQSGASFRKQWDKLVTEETSPTSRKTGALVNQLAEGMGRGADERKARECFGRGSRGSQCRRGENPACDWCLGNLRIE